MGYIVAYILLIPIFVSAQCVDCAYFSKEFKQNEKNSVLQNLTSLQLNNAPKSLDQSLLLMKDEKLPEEGYFTMNEDDRWEMILSKTHPYKAKFQHDRDKHKQKSRLMH